MALQVVSKALSDELVGFILATETVQGKAFHGQRF